MNSEEVVMTCRFLFLFGLFIFLPPCSMGADDIGVYEKLTEEALVERGWQEAEKIIGPVFCIGAGRDDNYFVSYYLSKQDILMLVTVEERLKQVSGDSLVCTPERPRHIRTFFDRDSALAIASRQIQKKLYPGVLCFAGPHSSEVAIEFDGPFWRFWDEQGNEYYMLTNLGTIPSSVAARNHLDIVDVIRRSREKKGGE
jgi:hypothetical protein